MAASARAYFVSLLVTLAIAGCGGGGGGGGGGDSPPPTYSISLTTQALNFEGPEFTTIPVQAVGATFTGAGVVVGTLPGQTAPSWLVIDTQNQSSPTQISFPIRVVTTGLTPGTYSTTLRFVTGDANGNNAVFVDLGVTLTLRAGFTVTHTGNLAFDAVVSSATVVAPAAGYPVMIGGEGIAWTSQAPSWLIVTPSSGAAAGTITLTAVTAGLPAGSSQGVVTFHDATSNRDLTVPVVLNVSYPAPLITPQGTDYTIDSTTDLSGTQGSFIVTDTSQGQNATTYFDWTVDFLYPSTIRTTPSLLTASPTAGSTFGPPTTVALDLDLSVLPGLPSGTYQLPVRINVTPSSAPSYSTLLNANVAMRMPRLGSAVPYEVPANVPATISLIGDDLRTEDLAGLLLDGQPLPAGYAATLVSAQEISLIVPAQAAGHHVIGFANSLNLQRSAAEFLVFTPPASPAGGDLPGTGKRVQLLYDDARARLYAVDVGLNGSSDGQLERYEWDGAAWQDLGQLAVPGIKAIAALRDGRRLLISAADGYRTLDLDSPLNPPTLLTDGAFLKCSFGTPYNVAVGEYGSVFMSTWGNPCSPYGHVIEYDLLNGSHDDPRDASAAYGGYPTWYYPAAQLASSGNGRYVAASAIGTSGQDYSLFDLRTRTYATQKQQGLAGQRMQVDDAGNKVLLNYTVIRDRAGTVEGLLPDNVGARLSPAGDRALIHVHGPNGTGYLQVYDVSAAVGASGTYPTVGAPIPVPFDMGTPDTNIDYGGGNITSFSLEWSADSALAFVSGSTRIAVIPVP